MKKAISLCIVAFGGVAVAFANAALPGNETITYRYDARGRLIQVQHAGTVNNNVVANYSYDKADNRTLVNVTGAP